MFGVGNKDVKDQASPSSFYVLFGIVFSIYSKKKQQWDGNYLQMETYCWVTTSPGSACSLIWMVSLNSWVGTVSYIQSRGICTNPIQFMSRSREKKTEKIVTSDLSPAKTTTKSQLELVLLMQLANQPFQKMAICPPKMPSICFSGFCKEIVNNGYGTQGHG